jgi:hypothetical protein
VSDKKNHVLLKTPIPSTWEPPQIDAKGTSPESWACVDCGVNTAPRLKTRIEIEHDLMFRESSENHVDNQSEVYMVRRKVWEAADVKGDGGCLCVSCLEKRIGRLLTPKDFLPGHPFNASDWPGTPRLKARREGLDKWIERQADGSHLFYQVASDGEVTATVVVESERGFEL